MATRLIFCANEQKETEHNLEVDSNGEIVATCDCGRFIKLPAGVTATEAETIIIKHKEANTLSEEQANIEKNRQASQVTIDALTGKVEKATK